MKTRVEDKVIKPSLENPQGEPQQTLREATPKCQLQKNSTTGVLRAESIAPGSLYLISAGSILDLGVMKEAVSLGYLCLATPCGITDSGKI